MMEETTRPARYTSLRDYLAVLRRYWLMVVLVSLIGAAAGYANAARQTAVYQATAQVGFQDPTQSLNIVGLGSNVVDTPGQLAAVNATTATGPGVMSRVRRELKTTLPVQTLSNDVVPAVNPGSGLLEIAASSPSPAFAARLANTVSDVLVTQDNQQTRSQFRQVANTVRARISRLKPTSGAASSGLAFYEDELARLDTLTAFAHSAQLAKPAQAPTSPSSPNKSRDTGLGLALGLLLGIVAAFVRDSMDRRLRTPSDFETIFGLPVIGHVRNQAMGHVAYISNGKGEMERLDLDAFRILRRNIDYLEHGKSPRSVLVTSAVAAEGKTTVAGSLALVLAAAGKRTLLVDCDLRRPGISASLGVEGSPGLTDYLAGAAAPQQILRTVTFAEPTALSGNPGAGSGGRNHNGAGGGTSPGAAATSVATPEVTQGLTHTLVCIPAGSSTDRGSELLGSGRFKEFIEQVTSRYDIVVLDSSPLLPVADTLEILPHVDAVAVCARESQTTRDQALAVRATLDRFPSRPSGVVVTGIRPQGGAYEVYAYSYTED